MKALLEFLSDVEVIVAYNAVFDKTVFEAELIRCGIPVPAFTWICAMTDVKFEDHYRCKQLSHLALDHGITVNPDALHGALGDCHLLCELLAKRGANIEEMVAYNREPWIFLIAELEKPWGNTEALAKKQQAEAKADNYSWERPRGFPDSHFPKKWCKAVKQSQLEFEKEKKFSFKREVAKTRAEENV
jgi:DNA polymerase III epsilon subunit-like protein